MSSAAYDKECTNYTKPGQEMMKYDFVMHDAPE